MSAEATPTRADTPGARTPEPTVSLLRPLVEDLEERRAKIREGGGEEKIAKQHERDKLTARERIALLIDTHEGTPHDGGQAGESTFTELGIHGKPHFSQRAMDGVEAPAESSSQMKGIRFVNA